MYAQAPAAERPAERDSALTSQWYTTASLDRRGKGAQAQPGHIWCMLYGLRAPAAGTLCAVYNAQGAQLGHARAAEANKGTLELNFDSFTSPVADAGATSNAVRPGCLVQLRPPKPLSPPDSVR